MRRREFIKSTCINCIAASTIGVAFSQLTSCAPGLPTFKTSFKGNPIAVPESSFGESNLLIVRDMQMDFDVLVVKKGAGEYNAIYMKCTHQANPLTATNSGLYCSAHGSSFDLDGNVKREPALLPLQKFKTEINNGNIIITLQL